MLVNSWIKETIWLELSSYQIVKCSKRCLMIQDVEDFNPKD